MHDSVLVARVRQGDAHAFTDIDNRHRAALVGFAANLVGNRATGEDVVQEALLRAHDALLADDRPVALRAWLYAIVRNGCMDELRRRRPVVAIADAGERACAAADPACVLVGREALRDVLDDVAALPARQRSAFIAHVLDGRAHREVAAEIGVSIDSTRVLLRRAQATLLLARAARVT